MAPQRWTSDQQLAFLKLNLDKFIEARKNKKLYRFWDEVLPEWFKKWPESLPDAGGDAANVTAQGEAIQKRKAVSFPVFKV